VITDYFVMFVWVYTPCGRCVCVCQRFGEFTASIFSVTVWIAWIVMEAETSETRVYHVAYKRRRRPTGGNGRLCSI